MDTSLRLAEVLATLSLATDLGLGQPMEYLLRTCLLASRLAERLGMAEDQRRTVYYTALLRWVGCTGHAHEASLLFGDEIGARARLALIDPGDPGAMLRLGLGQLGAGYGLRGRLQAIGRSSAAELRPEGQFRASCQVAQLLSKRLGMSDAVRAALWHAFERWDGRGVPNHIRGDAIDIAARVVHVAQDAVVFHQVGGVDLGVEVITRRSGQAYDPTVAAAFCAAAGELFHDLDGISPWERVLDGEPLPKRVLVGTELDGALEAMADYVDLKSPWTAGHSRGVAELASLAAEAAGLPASDRAMIRRAALLHDLGRCGVHNGIWDKPGPLTDGEWGRVRLHSYLTGRLLSRSAALAPLAQTAAGHHERTDGTGYHRGVRGPDLSPAMRLLAAADAYHAMTNTTRLPSKQFLRAPAIVVGVAAFGPITSALARSRCSGLSRAVSPTARPRAGSRSPSERWLTTSSTPTTRSGYRPGVLPCSMPSNTTWSATRQDQKKERIRRDPHRPRQPWPTRSHRASAQ